MNELLIRKVMNELSKCEGVFSRQELSFIQKTLIKGFKENRGKVIKMSIDYYIHEFEDQLNFKKYIMEHKGRFLNIIDFETNECIKKVRIPDYLDLSDEDDTELRKYYGKISDELIKGEEQIA